MGKTPEYTKNAIRNYQAGKDRVNLLLDYGTKERIKKRYGEDISITAYIKRLIENDLNGSAAVVSEQEVKRVPRRVSEQMPEQIPERVQEQTSQRVPEQVQEQTETRRRQPEGLPSFML
ncbi:MAG: hypothetical protein PUA89_12585 [Frisingicoccus sp.]|uniref:hypothetical protein n=1 Tax=Frisingicoccus sp. TaxID=1918627 RepID=UPI002619C62A|nr:hypothetical protein [Frisingicoccus sp.]MDD6233536.1 hypothetical protein [Frisingicoccus sp.]